MIRRNALVIVICRWLSIFFNCNFIASNAENNLERNFSAYVAVDFDSSWYSALRALSIVYLLLSYNMILGFHLSLLNIPLLRVHQSISSKQK